LGFTPRERPLRQFSNRGIFWVAPKKEKENKEGSGWVFTFGPEKKVGSHIPGSQSKGSRTPRVGHHGLKGPGEARGNSSMVNRRKTQGGKTRGRKTREQAKDRGASQHQGRRQKTQGRGQKHGGTEKKTGKPQTLESTNKKRAKRKVDSPNWGPPLCGVKSTVFKLMGRGEV